MQKPSKFNFSSGPCAKRSNWVAPSYSLVGRSHRSSEGLLKIQEVIELQKKTLSIPDDYFVGIVGASSSGAMETLLWSLLGFNGIDVIAHCVFSNHWADDIINELRLNDVRLFKENFPRMADVQKVDFNRDVVFCWSSTTSGTSFKNAEWIPSNRKGLTICDAASAVFCCEIDWTKLDATAFSWQKGLGGEAGFGTIVLSPKAIARLEEHKPTWPIPRIFRLAKDKKVNFNIFNGHTINTPSMICVEDFCDNLKWASDIGGIKSLVEKVESNYSVVKQWINEQSVFRFLVEEKYRAHHIACLDINSKKYEELQTSDKWAFLKRIVEICEQEKVGFDFLGHILTEPHLRIWIGPTIDADDLKRFLPWIEYAYNRLKTNC